MPRLTGDDPLTSDRRLAALAHERDLAIALKNDLDPVDDLVAPFDRAVNEQCVEFDECEALLPFIAAGPPVLGFSSIAKHLDLDAPVRRC